jgi:N-acetylglucosamine malate deacetylase 1
MTIARGEPIPLESEQKPEASPKALDVLAIAAHPDDVEQTCGGTLLRMAEMGYLTGILDLTAGDMGTRGTPARRIDESMRAAGILHVTFRGNLKMPDARLENTISSRMTLAAEIRRLRPRVVILPYWEGRHPDHYRASELGYEACFLAGLRKLDEYSEPHRPRKVIYSSLYADVRPSFVVDISAQFERRMESLFAYESQYGEQMAGTGLFPGRREIRERLEAIARFYGQMIGARYGEPYVAKETLRVDDIVSMDVRTF